MEPSMVPRMASTQMTPIYHVIEVSCHCIPISYEAVKLLTAPLRNSGLGFMAVDSEKPVACSQISVSLSLAPVWISRKL